MGNVGEGLWLLSLPPFCSSMQSAEHEGEGCLYKRAHPPDPDVVTITGITEPVLCSRAERGCLHFGTPLPTETQVAFISVVMSGSRIHQMFPNMALMIKLNWRD